MMNKRIVLETASVVLDVGDIEQEAQFWRIMLGETLGRSGVTADGLRSDHSTQRLRSYYKRSPSRRWSRIGAICVSSSPMLMRQLVR